MSNSLTPEMIRALKIIKETGSLTFYKGGFWQRKDAPGRVWNDKRTSYFIPDEYVRTNTLKALDRRGYINWLFNGFVTLRPDALAFSVVEVHAIVKAELSMRGLEYLSVGSIKLPADAS
jgi:hypothetical protein